MKNAQRVSALFVMTIVSLSLAAWSEESRSRTEQSIEQKAVLVTGASTGIGRSITELLASRGVFVYAGARKQKDLDELDVIDNVKSIRLDVTVQEEIDAAVAIITKEGRGLYGLVNNAGVAIVAPLIGRGRGARFPLRRQHLRALSNHQGVQSSDHRIQGPDHDHFVDLRHSVRHALRALQHE
jgi:NADPH:quinone reductase-like Zn-dependent oxidoreductase